MNSELEAILAADEEARVAVERAEGEARARVEAARAEVDRHRTEQRDALVHAVDEEVRRIIDEAERQVAERRARRDVYFQQRREAAEKLLPQAVDVYIQILRSGPTHEDSS